MTRFNIALLTVLLPSVLAAPSRRSLIVPCKRNSAAGSYDLGNNINVYGPTGTGTGFPLSTGVPISILSSSLADATSDPSAAPVDSGSDDCPATTTITSTNIVTETVIPATDPAQTQASGSSAAGSAVFTYPAGPYKNATDSSSQYVPGPTGTAGSTGRSSRHGHKHKHRTTTSLFSTGTSVTEVPASISTLASSSSSSSNTDASSSEVTTSEASDLASAVQATSTTASPTVDPSTSSDQPLAPITTSSTIADGASISTTSSTSDSSSTSESSTLAAGGEFYQVPRSKAASSAAATSSFASSSPASSSSAPSSSVVFSSAPSSSAPSSSVQSSIAPSSTSTTASSTTPTGASATVGATPNSGYSSNTGTGKRGLAYNAAALTTCFDTSSQVSWAYNWASSTSGLPSAFEYVPMLWGTQSDHTNNWVSAASAAIASGSKHLLSFNEPDLASQSNLSPAAAAAGHQTYLQPFAGRAKLSAPAVTNGGLAWLEQFLVVCSSCTIDFVPVHWYDSATNIAYFKAYITSAIAAAKGRPIWITEFGASGTQAQQVAFLQEVMPWLDGQGAVERYAYFGVFDGKLVSGTSLSALGQTFATYT